MKFSSGTLSGRIAALGMMLFVIGEGDQAHAVVSRPILKSYFQTGVKPTEQQFADLIDSALRVELVYGDSADAHGIRLDIGRID